MTPAERSPTSPPVDSVPSPVAVTAPVEKEAVTFAICLPTRPPAWTYPVTPVVTAAS